MRREETRLEGGGGVPPHQSELNEAARPSTPTCWKLKQKVRPEKPGHILFSTNQWVNCTRKRVVFAEARSHDQAVREAGGIRTDRQGDDTVEEVWWKRERQQVHGERQSRGARVCTKSMGWTQCGQRSGWCCPGAEPGDVAGGTAGWALSSSAGNRLWRRALKRARRVEAKKP